jgi:hypothetical protein
LPGFDLTDTQSIRVRMLLASLDLANHDLGKRWRNRLCLFHLQTRHRERISKLLSRQRRVTKFAEPTFGELHGLFAQRLLNTEYIFIAKDAKSTRKTQKGDKGQKDDIKKN